MVEEESGGIEAGDVEAGSAGKRADARRMRAGGIVRRPFLKTYLAILEAKMAGWGSGGAVAACESECSAVVPAAGPLFATPGCRR